MKYRKGVENHVDCLSRPPDWYTQYWRDHPEQDSELSAQSARAATAASVPTQNSRNPRKPPGEVWPVTIEEVKQLHDKKRNPVVAAAASQGDDSLAQWKVAQEADSHVCQYLDYLRDGTLPPEPQKG